jgi:copper(I)-binding protein
MRADSRRLRTAAVAFALLSALAACSSSAGSGVSPNSAGDATAVPGDVPTLGAGTAGAISVTATSIVRSGTRLTISAKVHNDGSTADTLVSAASQVSATLTLSPPLQIPAGSTVSIGTGGSAVVLNQNSRLEPDGTVVLTLQFSKAGAVQVFSSFHDAS